MTRPTLARTIGCVILAATAGACGHAADAKTAATPRTTTPTTVRKVNPYYDSGRTITITATGFQPRDLSAIVKVPIRFVNHTTTVQRVAFDHSRDAAGRIIHSTPIPPGGTWSYTPQNWESATYHSVAPHPLRGHIQIQPPAEP